MPAASLTKHQSWLTGIAFTSSIALETSIPTTISTGSAISQTPSLVKIRVLPGQLFGLCEKRVWRPPLAYGFAPRGVSVCHTRNYLIFDLITPAVQHTKGAVSAPVLMPVTSLNEGRL